MKEMEFLVNQNQNQLSTGFITILFHPEYYCPISNYTQWHGLFENLESLCSRNREWSIDFQSKLSNFLATVSTPPSSREKVIVLVTLVPILTGAQINIDPAIEKRYNAEGNILEAITSAFETLINSECHYKASEATTMYISSAIIDSGLSSSFTDEIVRYLNLVMKEREYTAADPTMEPPSIRDIRAYLDTTEENDYTDALKSEIGEYEKAQIDATDPGTKAEINAKLAELFSELREITTGTWKNIDAVDYPKSRIAEALYIREELAAGHKSRRIGPTNRFVRNNDYFLKVAALLIPPILFFALLVTTTITKP